MADEKITALTELTVVDPSDLVAIVDDPTGTPITKKATIENIQSDWHIGARVYNDADIVLADATVVYLTFNTERYDTDTIYSTLSNTGRLTCKTTGYYLIIGLVRIYVNADTDGLRMSLIRYNGEDRIAEIRHDAVDGVNQGQVISCIYYLNVDDYVESGAYENSGTAGTAQYQAKYSPEFMMHRIG